MKSVSKPKSKVQEVTLNEASRFLKVSYSTIRKNKFRQKLGIVDCSRPTWCFDFRRSFVTLESLKVAKAALGKLAAQRSHHKAVKPGDKHEH
jgi:hypothetical protein